MKIPLSRGKVAIIDDCDAHLAVHKWFANHFSYAVRNFRVTPTKRVIIYLHHAILGRPLRKGMDVDHINGDTEDEKGELHDGPRPFISWEVKAEGQPSANGVTTRPES